MKNPVTVDANEAVASVAYRLNEVIAVYPITPATPMGEWADSWTVEKRPNLWGTVPALSEMQSEGGVAGAVHGALMAGSLATTFTASQGLLLMLPNMYKIAGELTPFVLHVAARTLATHALSIFCDHSDVMSCRGTGFAMLVGANVQEAQDFACIAHLASLRSRIPFVHFFDGFRTSHELSKIDELTDEQLRALIDTDAISAHRQRGLSPDHPVIRGTAQNPDAFFQAREACNPHYDACVEIVKSEMTRLAEQTGRTYLPFRYQGHPQARSLIVIMGSGAETAMETACVLSTQGRQVGVLQVCLFRPFSAEDFVRALPPSIERVAVLDRTKEPGAVGEPLFLDVLAAFDAAWRGAPPSMTGGRYGLSSKEFTPQMVQAVFDMLDSGAPRRRFTLGIQDDVTGLSLPLGSAPTVLPAGTFQALFYGLGSDGTVGANKNSIKIIGEASDHFVQGYFVYDSKKAGAVTVSHLRFGPAPIKAPYLISDADFVACHQFDLLERLDIAGQARSGAIFLLNSPHPPEETWKRLSSGVQRQIKEKQLRLFVINAYDVAQAAGLGKRINTIMQTAFFALSGVIDKQLAITAIKAAIEHSYAKKGRAMVVSNLAAIDQALAEVHEIAVDELALNGSAAVPIVSSRAPEFVQRITASMLAGKGDLLPVSAFPIDGTWPTGTAQWEKRNLAREIPVWEPKLCIQCNKCALMCPHAAIRAKVYDPDHLNDAPEAFQSMPFKAAPWVGQGYTIQVAPEDCTGCQLCVEVCPGKDKNNPRSKALFMAEQAPRREQEVACNAFFLELPEPSAQQTRLDVKGSQMLRPLFEYSGACAGCGETPYIKLLTQLFGDRLLIANATGCSSIYGGNLPTTPFTTNAEGRGPAWANSLFEDNAEFGFGFRLALDAQAAQARELLGALAALLPEALVTQLLEAPQTNAREREQQRHGVMLLGQHLGQLSDPRARSLLSLSNQLVDKSVWLVGGDGWAYDIGYGGIDHVLASDKNVNILVLDTEVYSNTGGQQSKATPLGAAAKFATAGKSTPKKDLGLLAMSYGHVYVASVAIGAKDAQTVRALQEAEAHPGPSLVLAYSHCIAHGYDLSQGAHHQKLAVESAAWPLYRFDPARAREGSPPLVLDAGPPKRSLREYTSEEARFRMVENLDPQRYEQLLQAAQRHAERRTSLYEQLSHLIVTQPKRPETP